MGKKAFLTHVAKLVNAALHTADPNASRVSSVPAGDNSRNRALSAAGGTDQSDKASCRKDHVHAL